MPIPSSPLELDAICPTRIRLAVMDTSCTPATIQMFEAASADDVPSRPTMVKPSTVTSAPATVSEPV